jgi:hypothetical protein
MINLEKVFDDVSEFDTIEAIQALIKQGVTPEQYRAVYGIKVTTGGAELISQERQRQIEQEGRTTEHDKQYRAGDLARAAACYAMPADKRAWGYGLVSKRERSIVEKWWPWAITSWKPTPNDRIKELVKAGALIAAEIDRIFKTERGCHICGKNPSFLCEGCNTLACEDHYTQALCDTCMAKV